jgi:environmental stress-induced protein Ves
MKVRGNSMDHLLQTAYHTHRSYASGSWAGGVTRGVWADPPAAIGTPAAARCWAGTATIERNASYSYFAGQHRLQILIGGPELRLRFREPDDEVVLAHGAQHQFDGERPVEALLASDPVIAFNLIYRADVRATAMVATIGPTELLWPPDGDTEQGVEQGLVAVRLVYLVAGAVEVSDDREVLSLLADDTLVLAPSAQKPAPMIALRSAGPNLAEAILTTFWLPAGPFPLTTRPE